MFHIVLVEPEIPPNTGNIMRLCVNTQAKLHLIEPLGFHLSDKHLKRAGLDYLSQLDYHIYQSFDDFKKKFANLTLYLCTTKANTLYTTPQYQPNNVFVFGKETQGLSASILSQVPQSQKIKIPMSPEGRSLNLATAVGIVIYEAWRQHNFQCIDKEVPAWDYGTNVLMAPSD